MSLNLAFLLGFFGSLHCAVMCGPLMLGFPVKENRYAAHALQLLLYQLGRILTYAALGFITGLLGSSMKLFMSQEVVSFMTGLLLIVFTLIHLTGKYTGALGKLQTWITAPIGRLMGKFYGKRLWGFYAGLLNGLIPCGMVYLALASSLNSAALPDAVGFMLVFGIGTIPLMLGISLGGIYLKRYIRFNPQRFVPWFILLLGALLMLRSTDLGIPFISPDNRMHPAHGVECRTVNQSF